VVLIVVAKLDNGLLSTLAYQFTDRIAQAFQAFHTRVTAYCDPAIECLFYGSVKLQQVFILNTPCQSESLQTPGADQSLLSRVVTGIKYLRCTVDTNAVVCMLQGPMMFAGQVRLVVKCSHGRGCLTVEDNGPGIINERAAYQVNAYCCYAS